MDAPYSIRIRQRNDAPVRNDGSYVLYWMIAQRRTEWNFALQRAVAWAQSLRKPLWILEPVNCGYRWASHRLQVFVLQGMQDHGRRLKDTNVGYYPYVEPQAGAGAGLLHRIAESACVVVTDDSPLFFLPKVVEAAAGQVTCKLESVDSNGLLPLATTKMAFPTAYAFRRYLQKTLFPELKRFPQADPLANVTLPPAGQLPEEISQRWPRFAWEDSAAVSATVARLPIDHSVSPVPLEGGATAARTRLREFLDQRLDRYDETRNEPDESTSSGLSPYLHFGHISSHEVFSEIAASENWSVDRLNSRVDGRRSGWWNMEPAAESFLDQLITWRELGFNAATHLPDYDQFDTLPEWAIKTLARHEQDDRPYVYSLAELEAARTHDPLWNAAQRQLVREGTIHNYLRMLWGKKVLQWSPTPRDALAALIELNNKYALDGRDPNSYSGIFWIFGRYDRPWGPERPIFGTVRYMTSENTAKKVSVKEYLARWGA